MDDDDDDDDEMLNEYVLFKSASGTAAEGKRLVVESQPVEDKILPV